MTNTHNKNVQLRNYRGADRFGIRAGLTVGNPCYWSMLSLVFAKLFEKLQTNCENSDQDSFYSLPGIALISESPYLVLI